MSRGPLRPPPSEQGGGRTGRRAACSSAGLALGVYLATLSPTISYGGDCGDLVAGSYTLSNVHPTGYPFYLLLGRLGAALPFGEVAFRYNLLSALAAALAVGLLVLIVFELTAEAVAASLAGLSLAFFHPFWSQAVIAEVYTLAVAISAGQLLLALRAARSPDQRWWFAYALLGGVGLTHHLQSLIVFAPATVYLLARRRDLLKPRTLALAAAMLAAPLALYVYVPLRANADGAFDFWGPLWQPRAFWGHVTGALYRPHMFALSPAQILERTGSLAFLVCLAFFVTTLLIPAGVVAGLKRHRGFSGLLLMIAVLNLIPGLPYEVGDWFLFFFPLYLALAVFIGLALAWLLTWRAHFPWLPLACAVLPLMQGWVAVERANRAGNTTARDDARQALSQCPPGARLFVRSDELLFSCWYVQRVLKSFDDREVVSLSKLPQQGKDARVVREAVLASARQRETLVAFWLDSLADRLQPRGRVCRVSSQPLLATSHRATGPLTIEMPPRCKRELLAPVRVRWPARLRVRELEFALVAPPSSSPDSPVWQTRRALHPPESDAASLTELLALEIPPDLRIGLYAVHVRSEGEAWRRVAVTRIVDF